MPFRASLVLLLAAHLLSAQNCYGPTGNVSTTDGPCSAGGGVCCPLNWQCLSNGLCYLADEDFYGRYTCTDQAWQSAACPQICTHGNTEAGNEAVQQCADGSWCCDGNRSFDCCNTTGTDFFSLPQGSVVASISTLSSPSSVSPLATPNSPYTGALPYTTASASTSTTGVGGGSTTTTSASLESVSSSSLSHSSPSPSSSGLVTETSASGTPAAASTAIIVHTTAFQPPAASETVASSAHTGSVDLAAIIAPAVVVPVALAALAFCVYRQRQRHKPARLDAIPDHPANAYAPEIDSFPVATHSKRMSELMGSTAFTPGQSPRASPATQTGNHRSNYSPVSPYSPGRELHAVNEEPAELEAGDCVPYRSHSRGHNG